MEGQLLSAGDSGQPGGDSTASTQRSPLTLVEEDIVCVEGDTGEDIVGGTGVALVHPLDLNIQPVGREELCRRLLGSPRPSPSLQGASGHRCGNPELLTSSSSPH